METIKEKLDRLKSERMFHTLQFKHEVDREKNRMTAIGFEVAGKVGEEHILVGTVFMTSQGVSGAKIPLDSCRWLQATNEILEMEAEERCRDLGV